MTKLIPIYVICAILTFLSERVSSYDFDEYGGKVYIKKNFFIFFAMALTMAVFVGLRTRGNDTFAYKHMYEIIDGSWDSIKAIDWSKTANVPGFVFVNQLLKMAKFSVQDFLMVYSLFTVTVYFWFVRKHSDNILFSVFLVITMGVYTFTMAAIKQTTAVAFMLIAIDGAIERKYVRYALFALIAILFHPYSIILAVAPLLDFIPWSKTTYVFLLLTVIAGVTLPILIDPLLSITQSIGGGYTEESFSGAGVNIFRVLVVWVPPVLSFLARAQIADDSDRESNIILNLSMMNALIMFIGLFGTANYIARFANYFLIFQTLALPRLIKYFTDRSRTLLTAGACVGYSVYHYYEAAIANGSFNHNYAFITVSEYITQLFSR